VNELNNLELVDGKKLYVGRFQKKSERSNYLRSQYEESRSERLKKFMGVNLYVKNLDDKIDGERLKKEFSAFGQISSARVNTNLLSSFRNKINLWAKATFFNFVELNELTKYDLNLCLIMSEKVQLRGKAMIR
jgi:RNA recognition motif-containing protein